MAVILVLILGLILWGFIGSREEQEKEKRIAREKQENMKAKIREAESLIPNVESAAFYKEVSAYINNFIVESDKAVRWAVTRAYNEYHRSCSGYMKHVEFDDINWRVEDHRLVITCSDIFERHEEEMTGQPFLFQAHGYADLMKGQLYALVKVVLRNFKCLNTGSTEEKIQKCIFEDGNIELSLSHQYYKSIAELELQRLQSDQTPYKNAF